MKAYASPTILISKKASSDADSLRCFISSISVEHWKVPRKFTSRARLSSAARISRGQNINQITPKSTLHPPAPLSFSLMQVPPTLNAKMISESIDGACQLIAYEAVFFRMWTLWNEGSNDAFYGCNNYMFNPLLKRFALIRIPKIIHLTDRFDGMKSKFLPLLCSNPPTKACTDIKHWQT